MVLPTFYRILVLFIFFSNGGIKCENEPTGDPVVQKRVTPDQEARKADYPNQIELVISNILEKIEKINSRLNASEEMIRNLSQSVASFRLDVKNLSSVVFPEQPSVPPPLGNSSEPVTTQAPVPEGEIINLFTQEDSPFVLDVSTIPDGRGAIVFDGNKVYPRVRRFWTLERAGEMIFTMDMNKLEVDSRITISGFRTTENYNSLDHLDEVYINSSTANGTEFTVSGVVVLVTLTNNNFAYGRRSASSFILRFLHKRNDSILIPGRTLYPSTFVTGEARAVGSFPANNTENYENNADHFMLFYRPSGRDFQFTRTFLDLEWKKDYFRSYNISDNAERTGFIFEDAYSGRDGRFNWHFGRLSTYVIFFSSDGNGTGKGYEFKIEF